MNGIYILIILLGTTEATTIEYKSGEHCYRAQEYLLKNNKVPELQIACFKKMGSMKKPS